VVVKAPAKPLLHCSHSRRRDCSRFVRVIFRALACAALVSCAVGPDYQPPESLLPAKFAATSSLKGLSDHNGHRPVESTKWWRTLHDRELDSLVERAIGASPTLEIALDRLQQARAQEAVVIGAALPAAGLMRCLSRHAQSQDRARASFGRSVTRIVWYGHRDLCMSVFLKTCICYNVLTHRDQFHQRRRLTCRWPSAGPAWPGVDPAHCYSQQASGPGGEWRSTSLVLIAPFSERKRTVQAIQTSIPIGTLETWRLKVSASVQLMCARWPVHALLFSHKRELVAE
jgi:hypothetical protein